MKNVNRLIAVIAGFVILINAGFVLAQDWPQWRGANRDGKVVGFDVPEEWPWSSFHRHVALGWLDPHWPGSSPVDVPDVRE